jgi:hypothetical protein
MIIEDGKGSGKKARVDAANRLVTNSRSESIQHYTSHEEENAYQVLNVVPLVPGEVVAQHFYNNDPENEMILTYIRHQVIESDATLPNDENYFSIAFGREYVSDGLEITPVNVFNGSGNEADVTVYCSNPTLSGTAVEIDRWYTKEVGDMNVFNKEGSVVIGTGQTIEFRYIGTGTGLLYTRVSFLMMPKN